MESHLHYPTEKPVIDVAAIAAAVNPERLANDLSLIHISEPTRPY